MKHVVSVYKVTLEWGGPEEGGWWYHAGEIVRTMRTFKSEDAACAYCRKLNARLQRRIIGPNVGLVNVESVLGSYEYQASVHDGLSPECFPDKRPRYS